MSLNRGFIRGEIKLPAIPQSRVIIGIAAGLAFAFSMYALLYMGRESFRIFSLTEQFDLWVLCGAEVWFYNLFIAYLAAIFGQSGCMGFWFNRPSARYGKFGRSFNTVVNDLFTMNSFTLSWISKLAVVWGVFLGWTVFGWDYIPLYPGYIPVFILIIVVLFLNSWVNLLKIYKRRCWKWMAVSFASVSAAAFGLSFVNPVDYKGINDAIRGNNLSYRYGLELPVLDTDMPYSYMGRPWGYIGVVGNNGEVQMFYKGRLHDVIYRRVTLEELSYVIMSDAQQNPVDFRVSPYALLIDRNVGMRHVNRLKSTLGNAGVRLLHYMFFPSDIKNNKISDAWELRLIIQPQYLTEPPLDYRFPDYDDIMFGTSNIMDLTYLSGTRVLLNESIVEYGALKRLVYDSIKQDPDYFVLFNISDDMPYGDYLTIMNICREAVHELRDEHALELYGACFEEIPEEDRIEVAKAYPLKVFELTEDMTELRDMYRNMR